MESRAHAIAAGLFTLLLGACVVGAALWFSGDTYQKVYFELESRTPVTGLFEQAGVRFRGVDVGKVTHIRFDPRDPRVILIHIGVQSGTPVTRGTYAEIRPQGVTGLSYVMLDDTGRDPTPLPPAGASGTARIAVHPTLLENLFAASQDALAAVRQIADPVSAVLSDENRERLGQTLASLKKASDSIAAASAAAEPGLKSIAPLAADARKTLHDADQALAEIASAMRAVAARAEAIDRVAGSAEKASTAIEAVAESFASDSLPRINLLADELTRTTRGIDRLVADLRDRPQSLVFGRKAPAPGPGEPGFETGARRTTAPEKSGDRRRPVVGSAAPDAKGDR